MPVVASRGGAAAIAAGILGANVEVQFGDAAHDVIVGTGNGAGDDLAIVAALRVLVAGDQLVVGIFQFHFGDRGVETLDHVDAGLGQGAHRHQAAPFVSFLPEPSDSVLPV